jgi:F0F1-type ATP synthase assembly protein I
MAKISCSFCNTLNDAAEKTCVGCGAPLEAPAPQQVTWPQPVQQVFQPAQTSSSFDSVDSQKLQDGAQQVDRLYKGAISAYQTAWSVTSDAIAISMVAFALGLVGGATGMGSWGVLGALLAGLVIGFTEQAFWVNVIAPPAGALLGAVVWGIAWAAGAGPKGMVFAATGLACLGALIGARRRTTPLGCGAFVRPFLGAAGGFFFALLGLAFGSAIRAILK